MSRILIIGNGFDLNLELKTSYSDFIKSNEFRFLLTIDNHLAQFLNDIHDTQNWVDIEHQLRNYENFYKQENLRALAHQKPILPIQQQIKKCRSDFVQLKATLVTYLKTQTIDSYDISSLEKIQAYNIVKKAVKDMGMHTGFLQIFSFNYTNSIPNFLSSIGQYYQHDLFHIHGSLLNNNIVFGVEDGAVTTTFSFLNKSDHAAFGKAPDLSSAIIQATEIDFFGCSLGDTDDAHFKRAFRQISDSGSYDPKNKVKRKINFYIYGKEGYRDTYNRIMALTDSRASEFKLINSVTFFDVKGTDIKEIDQAWLDE